MSYLTPAKTMEVHTDRKSGESLENTDRFSATSAAKTSPNIIPLDLVGKAERVAMSSGHRPALRLEWSLQFYQQ